MKKETFSRWMDIAKLMDKNSVERGKLVIIFDDSTAEGYIYRNELGYCGIGYTDGDGYSVDFEGFCVLSSFVDVVSARKSFTDNNNAIEFRVGEKKSKIGIEEKVEINLPVWEQGSIAKLKSSDVISIGSEINYFVVDDRFCFGSFGYFGERKTAEKSDIGAKLSPLFVSIFELGKFDKFTVGEASAFMTDDDLEVMLNSSTEEFSGDLVAKFAREKSLIKENAKLRITDSADVKEIVEILKQMKNIGASHVLLKAQKNKVTIISTVGVELMKSFDVKTVSEFSGCFGEDLLNLLKNIGSEVTSIYADDVMFMFEGQTQVIANIVESVR